VLLLLFLASVAIAGCGEGGGTAAQTPVASVSSNGDEFEERTAEDGYEEHIDRANKHNIVRLKNTDNGRFLARSSVVLDRVGGKTVDPRNEAWAESSCTDCQTVAVALQVVVYKPGAPTVTPQNLAVALNTNCTRCVTVALAFQYVIPVGNEGDQGPTKVPKRVRQLIRELDRELNYFEQFTTATEIDPAVAESRLVSIINNYAELKQHLSAMREERRTADLQSPSPSPSPGGTPPATPTPTSTPTATP
jgi:putative peptide zinc metalloprotease protein